MVYNKTNALHMISIREEYMRGEQDHKIGGQ